MRRSTLVCTTLYTLFQLISSQLMNTTLYIGNASISPLIQINIPSDVSLSQTIISSNDFNCSDATGCSTDDVAYNLTLNNTNIQFKKANITINLINQPNTGSLQVYYVFNDTAKVGSVLGLASNSTFLTYYYTQNQKNAYNVSFDTNWQNQLEFTTFNKSNYTVLGSGPFLVTVTTNFNNSWVTRSLRMCVSNTIDNGFGHYSVFGVPAATYNNWTKYILSSKNQTIKEAYFTFIWTAADQTFLTQMNYLMTDFVDSSNRVLVRKIPDNIAAMKSCDIFTGTLMLQKFDFRLLYTESAKFYNYNYAFNSPNSLISIYDEQNEAEQGVSIWVILLILALVCGAIYAGYVYYKSQQAARPLDDGYMTMNIAPVEMQELQRSQV